MLLLVNTRLPGEMRRLGRIKVVFACVYALTSNVTSNSFFIQGDGKNGN